ncbi:aldo/keto reductase [Herbiconiux sp. CPCC 205716]|uniref:Aldo/keto reductase n=1 Tax=Herbiconiux gentiana TaxID=2970912 RepID=A0ABT2GD96_9MICO|nr:aldo/keto reductase [Herbiconiux gentiana]MCS5714194.1 aldo/keto reductase [Herbiconiux gentiana]
MTTTDSHPTASDAGTFAIGGELTVNRLGFGSMQLTGRNAFGPSPDVERAHRVLRRAVELGVTFIDTADAYGPGVAESLIASALTPYAPDLVIGTKGGFVRGRRGEWIVNGNPTHLREALEGSLKRLGRDVIDLYQLHRVDHAVPLADQIGALEDLRREGKIRHIGLSEVTVEQIQAAREIAPIATVQNLYNLVDRDAEEVVEFCTANDIGFIPWFPLATGALTRPSGPLGDIAKRTGASPSQIALAWLLRRSPVMIPIPGTSNPSHVDDNVAAGSLQLREDEVALLSRIRR